MKLLSLGDSNAKTVKSDNIQDEYLTAILYLSPEKTNERGINLCPKASLGCKQSCLFTAGMGSMSNVIKARLNKSHWFIDDKVSFLSQLANDIHDFSKRCDKQGKKAAVRLNGTSDILWEKYGIPNLFPNVKFYDYTKIYSRFENKFFPSNYHLTFSLNEDNRQEAEKVLSKGHNVAVVFRKAKPKLFMNTVVIDGDAHDLRFLDKKPCIIGLVAKGKAKKDTTGFVVDIG